MLLHRSRDGRFAHAHYVRFAFNGEPNLTLLEPCLTLRVSKSVPEERNSAPGEPEAGFFVSKFSL
jgi:hypothetical protein